MDLEQEILTIKQRNLRVEADKTWEKSFTRRFFIAAATYIIAFAWLFAIGDSMPWLKAFVPTIGYILSTLSLPFLKRWWLQAHTSQK